MIKNRTTPVFNCARRSRDRADRRGTCARQSGTMVLTAALAALAAGAAEAKTLKWGANREIASLDPYSYGDTFTLSVLNHVYEGLVRYNDELKIEPALATVLGDSSRRRSGASSCARASSSTTATPFTADDVIASLDARQPRDLAAARATCRPTSRAKKVDDHTIDIEVTDTYPLLLNDLTNIYIFDEEWLVENNATLPTDAGKGVEGYADQQRQRHRPVQGRVAPPDAETVFVRQSELVGQAAAQPRRGSSSCRSPRRRRASPRCSRARSTSPMSRRCRTCRACRPRPDVKVLQTNELRTVFFAFNLRDALVECDVKDKNPFKRPAACARRSIAPSTSTRCSGARCAACRATPARWSRRRSRATRRSRTSACPSIADRREEAAGRRPATRTASRSSSTA